MIPLVFVMIHKYYYEVIIPYLYCNLFAMILSLKYSYFLKTFNEKMNKLYGSYLEFGHNLLKNRCTFFFH